MLQLFSPALDMALVGKLGKHAFERNSINIFKAERAGDFARSDLGGLAADERKEFVLGRLARFGDWVFHNTIGYSARPPKMKTAPGFKISPTSFEPQVPSWGRAR